MSGDASDTAATPTNDLLLESQIDQPSAIRLFRILFGEPAKETGRPPTGRQLKDRDNDEPVRVSEVPS